MFKRFKRTLILIVVIMILIFIYKRNDKSFNPRQYLNNYKKDNLSEENISEQMEKLPLMKEGYDLYRSSRDKLEDTAENFQNYLKYRFFLNKYKEKYWDNNLSEKLNLSYFEELYEKHKDSKLFEEEYKSFKEKIDDFIDGIMSKEKGDE